jgi:polyhydroxyalkanoate synthase subunit PhaC
MPKAARDSTPVTDDDKLLQIQRRYWEAQQELLRRLTAGGKQEPVISAEPSDRRFKAPEWAEQPFFDYLRQSYLLYSRYVIELAEASKLEGQAREKHLFFTRRYLEAISPANFAATNPEVMKLVATTGGENLARGLRNMMADAAKARISLADDTAFEVGRNLAVTPGAVVFENEVMQLIQYSPLAKKVYERPLLIVPPCISKYYMLDLRPESSFVRYCIEEGHTVFLVSWRNPPSELGRLSWEDYVSNGVIKAADVTLEIAGTDALNALGFCVGGALLASGAAVLRGRGDARLASVTLLATLLDYRDSGDLGTLIDEQYVAAREAGLAAGGIVPGEEIGMSFASLRANEFIWTAVVNNYLKGDTAPSVDLLYWTNDQPSLPGAWFLYYIRNMYLENNLAQPGRLKVGGTPIDLGKIDVPAYVLGARDDHIVPWKCTYASARLLGGEVEYVVGASGHVAGIVNPPAAGKRSHWIGGKRDGDADGWLATAESRPGSWWPHWSAWLAPRGGTKVAARSALGNKRYREIEPAPGRYVRER